ncbi:MAG: non-canonical purine NTP pyrophosphatase, RdgB/HAM1 family [Alphaproteobacteria bacterium]|nr:MAG: non-canonical purine NTP pyrophosphatase, RdgB/HAM1 family [Alphaproteobacteria bacterium]
MLFPSKIVLATHNAGKVAEFQKLLEPLNVKIIGAGDLGLPEPEETEDSFEGNALLKARHACEITAMPCLADDSGLAVTALDGAPGIYSARWAGENKDFDMAMKKVWDDIGDNTDKSAQFVAVLALVMPDEREFVARGEVQGNLCYPSRGDHGFGYDPIFMPENEAQTFAELGAAGKSKYSHRVRAFNLLKAMVTSNRHCEE